MKFIKENKWYLIFLMAFAFTLYSQTISYDFISWDDDKQITENPAVKSISRENLVYNLQYERYTALSLFSYSLDYYFWGQNPAAFRLHNMLLHTLNVLLVFLFISLLGFNPRVAFFTALLFACHPLRVESIVWISERKDVLFAFWGLLSLIFYRHYIVSDSRKFFLIAAGLAIIASFSKIQGLLIPPTFFLIDYWYRRKITWRMALEKIILFLYIFVIFWRLSTVLFLLYIVWFLLPEKLKGKIFPFNFRLKPWIVIGLSVSILGVFLFFLYSVNVFGIWEVNTPGLSGSFDMIDRLFLASYSVSHYLLKFIFPFGLSAVYPYPIKVDDLLPNIYYISALIIIPVILFFYYSLKRNPIKPVYIFGGFFFLLNISMVMHIFPIEGRLVAADRYTYLAYLGLFLIVSETLFVYVKNTKLQWAVIFSLTFILTIVNFQRQPVWENTGTLFSSVVERDSTIAFALNNLAIYHLSQNQKEEALVLINKSLSYDKKDPMSWYNKGLILFNQGNYTEALEAYNNIYPNARSATDTALAMNDIGQSLIALGRSQEGVWHLKNAIKISSKLPSAYNNLGWYFYSAGQLDSAEFMFRKALILNPDYGEACNNLGSVLLALGKPDSVLYYFNLSIKSKPLYALAHSNKGYYLLQKNDYNGALQSFNNAIKSDSVFLQAYLNRAWIYFNSKEYTQAIHDYNFVLLKDSANLAALTNRAFSWHMLGKYELSIPDFTRIIELQPDKSESYFNRGRAYTEMKEYRKAIADLDHAIRLNKDEMSHQYRAYCYYELADYAASKADFLESVRIKPENSDCFYFLSMISEKTNNFKEACEFLSKAAQLGHVKAKNEIKDKCR